MPRVTFLKEKKTIEVPDGANLRREARRNGVELYSGVHRTLNCMGMGTCTSCRVYVKKGVENLSPPGWWERLNMFLNPLGFFGRIGHEQEIRLACQSQVNGDCEIETTPPMVAPSEKFWS